MRFLPRQLNPVFRQRLLALLIFEDDVEELVFNDQIGRAAELETVAEGNRSTIEVFALRRKNVDPRFL